MRLPRIAVALILMLGIASCKAAPPSNPLKSLNDSSLIPVVHAECMTILDANPSNPDYQRTLRRIATQSGYPAETRRLAFQRAIAGDRPALIEALELTLPKMDALEWRRELCEYIASHGWKEMTPTLIRAWARPMGGWIPQLQDRPEGKALGVLWGQDRVPDVIYQTMLEADPITEANLRARCWELLCLTGNRDRLVALLAADPSPGAKPDPMIADMRRAARELQVVPTNREEILWLQALADEAHAQLWREASLAIAQMPSDVRATIRVKDLPVLVAVARHRRDLLPLTLGEMYAALEARIEADAGERHSANFEGFGTAHSELLRAHRTKLTWGDCAVIMLELEALRVPEVRAHLFAIADRDLEDRSTEYGGLLRLDGQGRFEIVEYSPRVRGGDQRFEASNEMFEDGYSAISHFHFHAQEYENGRYAGPHLGDFSYANATGVNGMVFTFLSHNRLNVDYYRSGEVVVDLGVITRGTGK